MGWQDRDYARPKHDHGPVHRAGPMGGFGGGRSIVTTLLIANVAVFVICSITSEPGGGMLTSPVFRWSAMTTPAVLQGQVWRLVTSDYLHWSFGHILMNMIGLHFLGRPLERDWGPKKFFAIYAIAGVLGSAFYLSLGVAGWLSINGVAAGASGCVLALLGACAVRYPRADVYFLFVPFPVKIRTVAFVFGGWYVLNLYTRGHNAGGDACHLAGMIFGAWWAWRGDTWWATRGRFWSTRAQRGVPRPPRPRRARKQRGFEAKVAQRREDEETIDRILKKVYDGGIHSLTGNEKRALQEATERQRQREAEAGRIDRL